MYIEPWAIFHGTVPYILKTFLCRYIIALDNKSVRRTDFNLKVCHSDLYFMVKRFYLLS